MDEHLSIWEANFCAFPVLAKRDQALLLPFMGLLPLLLLLAGVCGARESCGEIGKYERKKWLFSTVLQSLLLRSCSHCFLPITWKKPLVTQLLLRKS